MEKKKLSVLIGSVCLILVLVTLCFMAVCAPKAAPAKTVWRLQSALSATYPWVLMYKDWATEVKKRTNGQLEIEIYPSAGLGLKPSEILIPVKDGILDAAEVVSSYVTGEFPEIGALEIPFLIKSYSDCFKAFEAVHPDLDKWLVQRYKSLPLAYWLSPSVEIYTKKPIRTIEDLRGLKLRSYSWTLARSTELLGAVPTSVTADELYMALKRGALDGAWTGHTTAVAYKFWEVLKYTTTNLEHSYCLWGIIVNKDKFNALPSDVQKVVHETARKLEADCQAFAKTSAAEGLATLQKNGMEGIAVNPEVRAEMVKRMSIMWDEWGKRCGAEGPRLIDTVRRIGGR